MPTATTAGSPWTLELLEDAPPSCRRQFFCPQRRPQAENCRVTGGENDVDCKSTSAGYVAKLLLPVDYTGVNITDGIPASEYPQTINLAYVVVAASMTRPLVMVPIATAFGILAALMFIAGSYKVKTWLDIVSLPHMSLFTPR